MEIKSFLKKLTPYPPGKPIEELRRELGIKGPIIKLASNENPCGPSPKALAAMKAALPYIHRYPEASSWELTQTLAQKFSRTREEIVLGNGSNEVIDLLIRALVKEDDEVIMSKPSFLMYEKFTLACGGKIKFIPLKGLQHDLENIKKAITSKTKLIFLDNPHNPTGSIISDRKFSSWLEKLPSHLVVVLDEAYGEFVRDNNFAQGLKFLYHEPSVVILRTFSKAYGLAGLRIGYGIMRKDLAQVLNTLRQPFNVNKLAYEAALASLKDESYLKKVQEIVWKGIEFLTSSLKRLGCKPYKTQANFILVDLKRPAKPIYKSLLKRGIIIRSMEAYGFPSCVRITVGLPEENKALIENLAEIL